ncbi:conserved exported hypothetical protein [Mesorhizobium plurifarium]|uniref:Uncharacterized protein n=1 Tax=Mesorhizobium plurifarium TaxID=69974 RepID=A0A090GLR4_MESPL|nr:conserved exported hypothetical protein [Mesorhizobium plurifarium]
MRYAIWFLVHLILVLIGFASANSSFVASIVGKDIAIGASASLVAAGITGFVLLFHNFFVDKRERLLNDLYDTGIRSAFDGRSIVIKSEYATRLKTANRLDVIGFGLSSFRQDYGNQFAHLARSMQIRILLLDPTFPSSGQSYAEQRDIEEGSPKGTIARDVEAFIKTSAATRAAYPDNFQIRLLKCLPSINYFRFDNELLWGPYLVANQSRNMPTLLVAKGSFLFDRLSDHFEKLWSSSELSAPCENPPSTK